MREKPMSLKAARVNAGLTQYEAADEMGVSVVKVRNWESGKTLPRVDDIKKIESAYNTKFADIDFFNEQNCT